MTEKTEPTPSAPRRLASDPADNDSQLRGELSTFDVVMMVLAYAGPLAIVGLLMSFVIGYGVGPATPLVFLLATAGLCLFSVGYVAMGRRLPRPGALYTYVTAGLGRPIGLSAGFLAILTYCFFGVAYHAGLAIVLQALITDFGGPSIPWPFLVAGSLLMAGVLGHFRIAVSATILKTLMFIEVTAILIWDAAVLVPGGAEGRSLESFVPTGLTQGSVWLALLLAAVGFVGFESTAIFRDEMRNPEKSVPRATFLAVLSIGLFYVLASWASVVAYGPGTVVTAARENPTGFFTSAVQTYLGTVAVHVVSVMLVMSYLAGVISEQNILARYFQSLGVDGVFSNAVGRVHPRHGSPFVANIVTTVVLFILLAPWVSAPDPTTPYAVLAAAGLIALNIVLTLSSFSVFAYFRRESLTDAGAWRTVVAPLAAGLVLAVATVFGVRNFDLISGDDGILSQGVLIVILATGLLGVAVACVLRRRRPEVYRRIGRSAV